MSEPQSFKVFLSAVTNELGSYRREVARVLRRKGHTVREQDDFRQGSATLLECLRDYILECDAVFLLVGDRCGAFPTADHVAALGDVPLLQKWQAASGQNHASYTQWEFLLARHHGRKAYVFYTARGFLPDTPNAEDAVLQACQAAYRKWIEDTGKHYDVFTNAAKLVEHVLVLPLPDLGRPKPIALPYASLGPLFKGRDDSLDQLHEALGRAGDGNATAIVGQAIHGLGGVGKTRLAVEYAWRHQDDFTALLFVAADTPEALRRNLAALCGPLVLDLPEQNRPEEEARLAALLRWLQQNSGWFLILDNLDTEDAAAAAEKFLARLHGGRVLFTSRLSTFGGPVVPLELGVLTEEAAADFLCAHTNARRCKEADDAVRARELGQELGHLALALEQAGAYINKQQLSFADYLAKWREQNDRVLPWFDERVMQYPRSVATTWQTSVDRLSEPARQLLHLLAWLAPEPIPESLLDVTVPGMEDIDCREALCDLETYSLVTRAPQARTFSVHRLVQHVTRRSLADDKEYHAFNVALRWVNAAFVGDTHDVRTWPTLVPLMPHARAVAWRADEAGVSEPTSRLMNQVGLLLAEKALHAEAEPLMRRALAVAERSFGTEHREATTGLNNLAILLQATNRLAEAEPLMRRALAIDERSFGTEHPVVATDLNNLAILLQATNRLAEAEPLMRRALAIAERSFGTEHPAVATCLNTLATLLQATNRLAEAEPLMRRALAIAERSFGTEHPTVATRLNNLATVLRDTNRLAEAEPLVRRALAIDERSFGTEHPEVATDLNNLAKLLQDTNRLAEAEPLMRRMVGIFLTFTGSTGHDHPNLQAAIVNYRTLLKELGRSDVEIDAEINQLKTDHQ